MTEELTRELAQLAHNPLPLRAIEQLELVAIDVVIRYPEGEERKHAKEVLAMAAEIRKARGCWNETTMTESEIDQEIAVMRGAS